MSAPLNANDSAAAAPPLPRGGHWGNAPSGMRSLWVSAFTASVTIHAGLVLLLGAIAKPELAPTPPLEPVSIPVQFIELPQTQRQAQSSASSPAAPSPAVPPSPSVQPSPKGFSGISRGIEAWPASPTSVPTLSPRPEPPRPELLRPLQFPSPSVPPLESLNLSPLPTPLPSVPTPPPASEPSPLHLPRLPVADMPDPAELTVYLQVQAIAPTSPPLLAQSDRLTFLPDPTGQSELAIATCPVVPEIYRFAGETVTLRVQLNESGTVETTRLHQSSMPSATYAAFATCLVEHWDLSRLNIDAWNAEWLLVSITVEG